MIFLLIFVISTWVVISNEATPNIYDNRENIWRGLNEAQKYDKRTARSRDIIPFYKTIKDSLGPKSRQHVPSKRLCRRNEISQKQKHNLNPQCYLGSNGENLIKSESPKKLSFALFRLFRFLLPFKRLPKKPSRPVLTTKRPITTRRTTTKRRTTTTRRTTTKKRTTTTRRTTTKKRTTTTKRTTTKKHTTTNRRTTTSKSKIEIEAEVEINVNTPTDPPHDYDEALRLKAINKIKKAPIVILL